MSTEPTSTAPLSTERATTAAAAMTGLTSAEVAQRVAAGLDNQVPDPHSRSFASILSANTFTYFNLLIGVLWVLMLVSAPLIDSLFGLVIVINTGIGVVQEWRAARTLARLSVVGQAKPVARRDGEDREVLPSELVQDDVVLLRLGDQLLVDGDVLVSLGLEIDESLLTGEADPMHKAVGDKALSGSFVVAGSGAMVATKVGAASYAAGLTAEARKFSTTRSELASSIQRFIRLVSYVLLPIGVLLFISQYRANDGGIRDAIAGTVPGVVTMVPEGLVLLTSIAMAVSVIRLARKRALVQEMPAVEVLARVDVVCVDKTGTLTGPGMHLRDVVVLDDDAPVDAVLAALAGAESDPNPTLAAVAEAYPGPGGWQVTAVVPFSSARKWSGATFQGHGSYVMGAPELLLPEGDPARATADVSAATGARVLVLAESADQPDADRGPGRLRALALLVIDQRLRSDAADTVRYFLDQGVTVKVISGDNPVTVGAIAAEAGIPDGGAPVDARTLPEDPAQLEDAVERSNVFGRVTPSQKRAMVGALQRRGHTVAMTGDGVNDVLALKDADLGIAMGSGSAATRAVAQIVLLDDAFSVMPSVVAEGRRVLATSSGFGPVPDQELLRDDGVHHHGAAPAVPVPEPPPHPRHGVHDRDPGVLPGAHAQHRAVPDRVLPARRRVRGARGRHLRPQRVRVVRAGARRRQRHRRRAGVGVVHLVRRGVVGAGPGGPALDHAAHRDLRGDGGRLHRCRADPVPEPALRARRRRRPHRAAGRRSRCRRRGRDHDPAAVRRALARGPPRGGRRRRRCPRAGERGVSAPKVTLSTASVYPESTPAAFEMAARLGYDGVEVMVLTDAGPRTSTRCGACRTTTALPITTIHAPVPAHQPAGVGHRAWAKLGRGPGSRRAARRGDRRRAPAVPVAARLLPGVRQGIEKMADETAVRFAVENMYPWRAGGRGFAAYPRAGTPRRRLPAHDARPVAHRRVRVGRAHDGTRPGGPAGARPPRRRRGCGARRAPRARAGFAALRRAAARPGAAGFGGQVVVEISTRKVTTRDQREADLSESLAFAREHLGDPAVA